MGRRERLHSCLCCAQLSFPTINKHQIRQFIKLFIVCDSTAEAAGDHLLHHREIVLPLNRADLEPTVLT